MAIKRTLPTLPLTDPNFRYRHSSQTDLHKTFARVRRQLKAAEQAIGSGQQQLELDATTTVVPLPTRGRSAA